MYWNQRDEELRKSCTKFNNNIRCIEIYISDMVDYYASGLITT